MDEIVGLMVGYRDAYTYGEKLAFNFGELPEAQPEVAPVSPETATVPPVEPTLEQESQAERARATAQPPATETLIPSATPLQTSSPAATETSLPTATHLPTARATLETVRIVEVISPQQVRIRRGPTTADDILQLARTGNSFEVTGTNGDGSWYSIALSNGLDGWIAAFLVEERIVTAAEFQSGQASAAASLADERVFLWRESIVSLGKTRSRFYQSNSPVPGDELEYIWMRDRSQEVPRLGAMTFGTLAAILLIAVGNVFYALAALRRRGREAQSE